MILLQVSQYRMVATCKQCMYVKMAREQYVFMGKTYQQTKHVLQGSLTGFLQICYFVAVVIANFVTYRTPVFFVFFSTGVGHVTTSQSQISYNHLGQTISFVSGSKILNY